MSYRYHLLSKVTLAGFAVLVGACTDSVSAPTIPDRPSLSEVKFWEVGSSVAWNRTARELIAARAVNDVTFRDPARLVRILTYLSVAQYNAVLAAEDAKERGNHASPAAAAAGASLVVLKSFFAQFEGMEQLLDARLEAQLDGERWPGEQHTDLAAGEAIGRAIGADVVAYAATDGFNQTAAPPNPGGPNNWKGSNPFRGLYGTRLFVLESADQFRPPPHPAVGSAEFNAALDEVRALAADPTPAQRASMTFWAPLGAPYMNQLADEMIVAQRNSEREAARVFALANMAGFDVANACFDGKFAYYLIRPWELDNSIQTRVGRPAHPSYPSGHSCITSAYATVLGSLFPSERGRLDAMIEEAGMSRIYAGLHYRFDCEAGQELGRQVARYVLANGADRRRGIPLD
jgi:hypothetical protein